MYEATFRDVKREVFTNLSDRIESEDNLWSVVTVYYNGTNIKGALTIDCRAGYSDAYKKALDMFNEEYCKIQ